MTTAKGYTEMKDSGIQWIGQIPTHWLLKKAKYCVSITNGSDPKSEGSVPVYGSGSESFKTCGEYKEGPAVLIGRKGATLHIPHYIEGQYWNVDTAFDVKPQEDFSLRYYYYLACVFDYNYYISQTTLPGMTQTNYNNMKLPCPSLDEQTAIASYLDAQCAKIDEIIAQAKASIEDYKQWKASIIYEAVTKGLDPNVEMKDSGIEWIGKMPKRWQDINPKALFSQRKERANPGDRQLTASQQFGVIYQDEYMELTGAKVVTVEKDFDILKHVSAGDFVISMRSFQGGLEYSTKSGSISSAYVMLVPNLKLVYPRYYRWLLKSNGYIRALQSTSDLVRDGQAMRYSNFAKVRLINPPIGEQEQIANYLDTQCAKIDTLMTEKQSLIDDLESYKKSLIYEVVTGKRRV